MASKKMVDVCTLGGMCDGICRKEHLRQFNKICGECYSKDMTPKKKRSRRDEEDDDRDDRY